MLTKMFDNIALYLIWNDKFDVSKQKIIHEGHKVYVDILNFYTMKNVFFLSEKSRWSYIL